MLQRLPALHATIGAFNTAAAADGPPQSQAERLERLSYLAFVLNSNPALLGHTPGLPSTNYASLQQLLDLAARFRLV